jgi:hypothetical protein
MRLNVGVLSTAVVLTCARLSIAGPLFPCPTAVNSVHGDAMQSLITLLSGAQAAESYLL